MSQFIIEQIRYLHEEIEIMEKAIAELIEEKSKNNKKRMLYDYSIKYLIDKIENKSKILLVLHEDEDNLKKEEIQYISGKNKEGEREDVWKHYYEKIKYIKDYHKKNNVKKIEINNSKVYKNEALKYNNLKDSFSPIEKNGKYIDMESLYNEYINIKKIKEFRFNKFKKKEISRLKKKNIDVKNIKIKLEDFKEIDMITYLNNFSRFNYIPRYCKYKNEEYKNYLQNLLNYLVTFFMKINVLVDCQQVYKNNENIFEEKFQNKEIEKWNVYTYDLDYYCNINDKLFASENVYNGYLKSKKYQKDLKKYSLQVNNDEIKKKIEEEDKNIAKNEFLIELYKNLLYKIIQKTIQKIQKKQAFTIDELEKKNQEKKILTLKNDLNDNQNISSNTSSYDSSIDNEDNISDANNENENEEDKTTYNPLNLPLGFDNKPIPYWLYKLHGLSKEYKCEICGNYSYFGRTAFEKHFYEWRHSFGMKCLKIPNTLHFKEITKIEDALNLYEKLKRTSQSNAFIHEQEMECEDSFGNVMNAKTFEELKLQGLI